MIWAKHHGKWKLMEQDYRHRNPHIDDVRLMLVQLFTEATAPHPQPGDELYAITEEVK